MRVDQPGPHSWAVEDDAPGELLQEIGALLHWDSLGLAFEQSIEIESTAMVPRRHNHSGCLTSSRQLRRELGSTQDFRVDNTDPVNRRVVIEKAQQVVAQVLSAENLLGDLFGKAVGTDQDDPLGEEASG